MADGQRFLVLHGDRFDAGASHFVLRFAGDQHRHLDLCAGLGA